jgi:6-phosphofructokinase 1
MKNIAVFTSGGDAPGMNACIRAVVRTCLNNGIRVFGIRRGYEGMIDNDIIEMTSKSVSNIIQNGGTILQTARSDRFRTPEGRKMAYKNLKKNNIHGVVCIGGNGTFTGAKVFMEEYPDVAFVGTPGTIDNDLFGTDYTIGYDTAVNTAMHAIDNIKDTANAHNRLFFVEVMGRDAGFIALKTCIATGAEAVLIPETPTDFDKIIDILERRHRDMKMSSSIVIVAEGDEAGGAFEVAEIAKKRLPNYDIKVTILGHIQRGGSPTCSDRVLASRLGMEAVKALMDGVRGVMVGQQHHDIVYIPFAQSIKHNQTINPQMLELVDTLV